MIDIRAELEEVRNSFISIYDFISVAKNATGEDVSLVCQWVLKRVKEQYADSNILNICIMSKFHEIEFCFENVEQDFSFLSRKLGVVIEKGCLPIEPDDIPFEKDDWGDNGFFEYGFKKKELETFFPELKTYLYQDKIINDGINKIKNESTPSLLLDDSNPQPTIPNVTQGIICDFSGKETALMLIAGLAVALEKTSDSFKRGGKMNKSAVVMGAERAINNYGTGVNVTSRALRDWLNLALSMHTSKLDD